MSLGMNLEHKQSLQVKLTPELRQSLNLLQYSSIELKEFLYAEQIKNPLLEIKEAGDNDFFAGKYRDNINHGDLSDHYNIEHNSLEHETLENYLMEQTIDVANVTSLQRKLLEFMIYNLNEYGFLEVELPIIARIFTVPLEEVEHVLAILQSLDPIGVGARNLTECLLLQLHARGYQNSLTYQLVENGLEEIAQKKYVKLAKAYSVSTQEIQAAVDLIQTLNPRPCSQFSNCVTNYIEPDVMIEKVKQDYMILINDDMLPSISINKAYHFLHKHDDQDVMSYCKEKYQEVLALMNGLAQRKLTLFKVTKVIVEKQKSFLQQGIVGLKPMTLKDVAAELGYHESTISRAISNKYIQTPHGLFKIRSLFTSGTSNTTNFELESPVVIKEKIRELINQEDARKPLSDQMLLKLLEREGIAISRRTVAKYREEIGIQSSMKRKRF